MHGNGEQQRKGIQDQWIGVYCESKARWGEGKVSGGLAEATGGDEWSSLGRGIQYMSSAGRGSEGSKSAEVQHSGVAVGGRRGTLVVAEDEQR